MNIKEMHYDLNIKLNKVDSQQYKNLLIPEKDWLLNEAQEVFVKMVASPRFKNHLGFETNQRSIDDIRTIVVEDECIAVTNDVATLPDNYWFYVGGSVVMTKEDCTDVVGELFIRQHDDRFEESSFDKSSFEWRIVNATFFENGIKVYTDGTFTTTECCIDYIRKLSYIHNAEDFGPGNYNLPGGVNLTNTQDCELPEHTHREIVDIAVLIATGQMQIPDYQVKQAKLALNNLS